MMRLICSKLPFFDNKVDEEEAVKPEDSTKPEAAASAPQSDALNPEQTFPNQEKEENMTEIKPETEQPTSPTHQEQVALLFYSCLKCRPVLIYSQLFEDT